MLRNPDRKPRGWSDLVAAVEALERRVAAEAAALMYLALGAEEIRTETKGG